MKHLALYGPSIILMVWAAMLTFTPIRVTPVMLVILAFAAVVQVAALVSHYKEISNGGAKNQGPQGLRQ